MHKKITLADYFSAHASKEKFILELETGKKKKSFFNFESCS